MDGGEGSLSLRFLTWNLFHGRDDPPHRSGAGAEWKVLGRNVKGERHVLVNRSLLPEFIAAIDRLEWDVALLQEVPPTWGGVLARGTGSLGRPVLTSRNWMSPFTWPVWSRRPQLVGSWEGGSNLILIRGEARSSPQGGGRKLLTRWPERRAVHFVRLSTGLDVYVLHASTGSPGAADDVLAAADFADRNSGSRPLVLGGDFNCRPAAGRPYPELVDRFGLSRPPEAMVRSIDHLLVRGLEVVEPPRTLPASIRDVPDRETGASIRLSDHDPVVGTFRI